ncbi:MAG: stage II sporulation protein P [Clostridia bacterium]|nr:stage II sporulation protein P [Clostridia bacterium]
MNKAKRGIARYFVTAAIAMGSAAVIVAAIPDGQWLAWGQQTALLSIGLRQPEGSAQLLEEWVQGEPAGALSTTDSTSMSVQFSPVESKATAVTTTTGTVAVPTGGGRVLTQQLSSGSSFIQGVAINNKSGKTADIAAALRRVPALSFDKASSQPQVLITHTHTTECYLQQDNGVYRADDATRTHDTTKNVVAVGNAVAAQLRQAGIGVIHDTVIHDEPYNGAYNHSKAEVERLLKQYPTIRVVLDIHRDAIYPSDTTRVKPTAVIDGKKAAQVMIIVGMKNTTAVPNKHVQENLAFGVRLQQYLHTTYTGLMRPLLLADARYNQHLTNGSLLIEMGSDANTTAEAMYSGELVGKGLAQVLRNL